MQRVRDSPVKNLKFCGDSTGLIEPHWCSLYLLSNAGTKRLWADDMCSIYLFPKFSLVCWVPPSHYIILHNCSLQSISYCISFILCNRLWFCLCLHFVCYMVICHFIPTEGSVGEEFLVLSVKEREHGKGKCGVTDGMAYSLEPASYQHVLAEQDKSSCMASKLAIGFNWLPL